MLFQIASVYAALHTTRFFQSVLGQYFELQALNVVFSTTAQFTRSHLFAWIEVRSGLSFSFTALRSRTSAASVTSVICSTHFLSFQHPVSNHFPCLNLYLE